MRTTAIPVALLASIALHSCAAQAFVQSQINAARIGEMQRAARSIETWEDAAATQERSEPYVPSDSMTSDPVWIAAPAWVNRGLELRVARLCDWRRVAYAPELQTRYLSESKATLRYFADAGSTQPPAVSGELFEIPQAAESANRAVKTVSNAGWHRIRLGPDTMKAALATGLNITVKTAIGDWVYRMPPEYFRGFEAKCSTLRDKGNISLSDDRFPE